MSTGADYIIDTKARGLETPHFLTCSSHLMVLKGFLVIRTYGSLNCLKACSMASSSSLEREGSSENLRNNG